MKWNELKVGQTVTFRYSDFDGKGSFSGKVIIVESDHAIIDSDGMKLWCDDDTEEMFY